jgi:hypothetical protein
MKNKFTSVINKIDGAHSVFDVELSKLAKKIKNSSDREQLWKVAKEKINYKKVYDFAQFVRKEYVNLILKNSEFLERAKKFSTFGNDDKMRFAQDVVDYMVDMFNKSGFNIPKIEIKYRSERSMGMVKPNKLLINFEWPSNKNIKTFLSDLLHEIMHWVDLFDPDHSPLGAQIAALSYKYYNSDDGYANPMEMVSYQNEDIAEKEFAKLDVPDKVSLLHGLFDKLFRG